MERLDTTASRRVATAVGESRSRKERNEQGRISAGFDLGQHFTR